MILISRSLLLAAGLLAFPVAGVMAQQSGQAGNDSTGTATSPGAAIQNRTPETASSPTGGPTYRSTTMGDSGKKVDTNTMGNNGKKADTPVVGRSANTSASGEMPAKQHQ
jgi:hypothetical protein